MSLALAAMTATATSKRVLKVDFAVFTCIVCHGRRTSLLVQFPKSYMEVCTGVQLVQLGTALDVQKINYIVLHVSSAMVNTKGGGRNKGTLPMAAKNAKRAADKHVKKKVKPVAKQQVEEEEEEEQEELHTEDGEEEEEEEEGEDDETSDSTSSTGKTLGHTQQHKDKVADRKRAIAEEENETKILEARLTAQQKINVQRHHDLREKRNEYPDDNEVIDMFL